MYEYSVKSFENCNLLSNLLQRHMVRNFSMPLMEQKRMWREVEPTRKQQQQPKNPISHIQDVIAGVGYRYHRKYDMQPETKQEKNPLCGTVTNIYRKILCGTQNTLRDWCQRSCEFVNYSSKISWIMSVCFVHHCN